MKLSDLQQAGGLVSDEPVDKDVEWHHGGQTHKFKVRIQPLAYGDFDRILTGHDTERSQNAALIAASVLVDDDKPMPYQTAYRLKPSLASALIKAVGDVNDTKT